MRNSTDRAPRLFYHVDMVEAALTPAELQLRLRLPERWPPDTAPRRVLFRLTGAREGSHQVSWVLLTPPRPRDAEALLREVRVADAVEARLESNGDETVTSLAAAGLLSVHNRLLTPDTIDTLLSHGERVPIPLGPATSPFDPNAPWLTLSGFAGPCAAELHWQGEGPESWRPFTRWIDNLRQTLHQLAHGLVSRANG
jgi:hypothetical protein